MISLEKLCFNLIVEKFQRFHLAFSVSKNEILKRHFEFLQRKYSSELASELYNTGGLTEEYLEFLLNERLTFLDVTWLKSCCYRKSIKDILPHLPNLKKLFCSFDAANDEILENVAKFCPKIEEIEASCSCVTDIGIACLWKTENGEQPCPNLKRLTIKSSFVTVQGLTRLIQNLPSLEIIDYKSIPRILYSLHKEDLHNSEKLPNYNLIELDLFECYFEPYYTDLLKTCLTVCPKLKSLKCIIRDETQLHLLNNIIIGLEELTLENLESNPRININNFFKINGKKMMSLKISHCIMSIKVLAASCPKLEHLNIESAAFSDDDDDSECSFHCLTYCILKYITDDSVTNAAVNLLLSSSPNLECLKFKICILSPETKTAILKCCESNRLKKICFSGTKVEVKFIKDILLSCSSLKTLSLKDSIEYYLSERMQLIKITKALPNRPDILVNGYYLDAFDRSDLEDSNLEDTDSEYSDSEYPDSEYFDSD